MREVTKEMFYDIISQLDTVTDVINLKTGTHTVKLRDGEILGRTVLNNNGYDDGERYYLVHSAISPLNQAKLFLGCNFLELGGHYGNSYFGPLKTIYVRWRVSDQTYLNKLGFGVIVKEE